MQTASFRFAVWLSLWLTVATAVMAWVYDLPIRDPDSVAGPTYLRLPAILLLALALDVVPRAVWRSRSDLLAFFGTCAVVWRERWTWPALRFAMIGLGAWYLTYSAFRNLKSFVPFVNQNLWDAPFDTVDRFLFFGHDPAQLLHSLFGTGFAAHFFSAVYIAWIVLVPVSLAIALVWSRTYRASAWFVTAIAVDWALGAVTYFIVPSLGPAYARPENFADLPHTPNTDLINQLMEDRFAVLTNPHTTDAVQTIAAFASLHVGITVTMCVMAELLRMPKVLRVGLWVFLGLTVLATIYLGWHYALDAVGGFFLGYAGVAIAAWGTGNQMRRRTRDQIEESAPAAPVRELTS